MEKHTRTKPMWPRFTAKEHQHWLEYLHWSVLMIIRIARLWSRTVLPMKSPSKGMTSWASSRSRRTRPQLTSAPLSKAIFQALPGLTSLKMTLPRDATSKYDLGLAKNHKHRIHLKIENPVYWEQFKITEAHHNFIEQTLEEWLKLGVVWRSDSLYNSIQEQWHCQWLERQEQRHPHQHYHHLEEEHLKKKNPEEGERYLKR